MNIEFEDFGSEGLERQVRAAAKQKAKRNKPKKKKQKSIEAGIQKAILEYLEYRGDIEADRINSGKVQTVYKTWIQLAKDGTADIIGAREVVITQDMVGEKFAQFLAIEVKKPNPSKTYPSKVQREYIEMINDLGGLAFVARSVEDVVAMLPYEIAPSTVHIEEV